MKPDILVLRGMRPSVMAALEAAYTVHRYWERPEMLAEIGPSVRGVATNGGYGLPAEVLEACPKLEIVASYGVGYDAIDIEACRARGVRVSNTPDVLNDAVAEMTIGLMIALCRRIPHYEAYLKAGRWLGEGEPPLTGELTGRVCGILGLGRIGKEIARRAQAMKMQVVYHGRSRQAHEPYPYYADLVAMARDADWLVVIAPGSPETRHIVDRKVMEALGPGGSLVNVARGSLVDEEALIACLTEGKLGGAALDVFADEPRVPEALMALPNVVLSPHMGSATEKTREGMGDLVVRNLAAHFAGRPLLTPVA